jgi:HEAT repeat protein
MALFLTVAVSGTAIAQEFTSEDEQTLKNSSDPDAVMDVLYKLQDIYADQGASALEPAVPALIAAAEHELTLPEEERWNLVEIVKVISLTGDERTKPLLLRIMSEMWAGGNPFTAQGLVAIGPSTLQDVADSLKSPSEQTQGRAATTAHKMYQLNSSIFTAEDKAKFRDLIMNNVETENVNLRIYSIIALRSFGDETVMDELKEIEETDAHKDSGGNYIVREEAAETIEELESN